MAFWKILNNTVELNSISLFSRQYEFETDASAGTRTEPVSAKNRPAVLCKNTVIQFLLPVESRSPPGFRVLVSRGHTLKRSKIRVKPGMKGPKYKSMSGMCRLIEARPVRWTGGWVWNRLFYFNFSGTWGSIT